MRPKRSGGLCLLMLVALVLAATLTPTLARAASTPHASARRTDARYYVAIGDSYAVGYQPSPVPGPTAGYAGAVARATHLQLADFGCSGATTASVLQAVGCAAPYGPPASTGAVSYAGQTQAAAATHFLRRHRGHVALVTVSIGGNDIARCAAATDPATCVLAALPAVRHNVETLADRLRAAAGSGVPLIGLTYPDVFLGLWVYPSSHPDPSLATLSVTAFKDLFNPTLADAYRSAGAHFLDVTRATGAYTPLSQRTTLPPYGSVPEAVAQTCALTWFCQEGNIHATTAGYTLIGRDIVVRYRSLTR